MTGLLIIAAMVLPLVLALGPAHRRAGSTWRPGFDTTRDRDRARTRAEFAAASHHGGDHSGPHAVLPGRPGLAPQAPTQPLWLPEQPRRAA